MCNQQVKNELQPEQLDRGRTKVNDEFVIIASHTMPGPSAEEINTVVLLTVLGPVLVSSLLIILVNPSCSWIRRIFAAVVGFAIGTAMMTLSTWIAMFFAAVIARTVEGVASYVVVAMGFLLLAVLGVFCLALTVRLTQALCHQWKADLFATHVRGSCDRWLASSWAIGLLLGLVVSIVFDTFLSIGIGAMGGTLIAAGLHLRQRGHHHARSQ